MTTKALDSISAQIAAARKSITGRPDWMKSVAHFSEPRVEPKIPKKSQTPDISQANRKSSSER